MPYEDESELLWNYVEQKKQGGRAERAPASLSSEFADLTMVADALYDTLSPAVENANGQPAARARLKAAIRADVDFSRKTAAATTTGQRRPLFAWSRRQIALFVVLLVLAATAVALWVYLAAPQNCPPAPSHAPVSSAN